VACECNIVGLLTASYQGIFSAAIDGSTAIEVSEDDGTVLLGQTVSTLSIGAYAYIPGEDRYLGATCPMQASAQVPWVTKYDCANDVVYFIPKAGGKASIVNGGGSGVDSSIISLECSPGIINTNLQADATSGPATPYIMAEREDGYNLVYTGNPIPIESAKPQLYEIELGFVGTIRGFLQNFSLSVSPPAPAKVQYSFVFSGVVL
jgi:hypothetical protein